MHTASRVHSQIKYAMYTASRVPKRLYFVWLAVCVTYLI